MSTFTTPGVTLPVDINSQTTGNLAISRLASIGNLTALGNVSGSTAAPVALTATQLTTIPNAFVGDSGSGGTKGLVPAPGSGDAAAGKFLKADGTFAVPAGSGITGSLNSGRITLSTGTSTVADDPALLFSSASSVGTVTIGNSANGIVKGGSKLILQTSSNADVEITPNGTGKTNITAGILQLPSGSQGTPSLQPGGNANFGIYLSGEPSIVITAGGGNMLTIANGNTRSGNDFRPVADVGNDLGQNGARWKDAWVRSYIHSVSTITGTTTLDATYYVVLCSSGSPFTVNLPAAASNTGRVYFIKNINTGTVTIDGNASETIDGATTYSLSAQYQGVLIVSNGTNWFIL
jgi:hypothetical protein